MSSARWGIGLFFFGLICPPAVFASRAVTILTSDFTLSGEETKEITASYSGFSDGEEIRIKGAFFKDGSTNYFGYTKNGDVWIKNSAATTEQILVTLPMWQGKIQIRNDGNDSGFSGSGEYLFKLRYYYNSSSSDWSENALHVTIIASTPTCTPSPSSTPTPTINTFVPATSTPLLTLTPTPSSNPISVSLIEIKPSILASRSDILGIQIDASTGATEYISSEPVIQIPKEHSLRTLAQVLVGIGTLIGILATILSVRQSFIWKNEHHHHREL